MSGTRRNRWDRGVPWEVPRDMAAKPAAGMRWAATGRCLTIGPDSPPQVIRADDWGDGVACQVQALMVVSALQARIESPSDPWQSVRKVLTRRPVVFRLGAGSVIKVSPAESRTGELWVFPLTDLAGPPRPLADRGRHELE